jgi:hypothetical protein
MKKLIQIFSILSVFLVVLSACGPYVAGAKYAVVIISTGAGSRAAAAEDIVSFSLTVSADDMETIEQTFTGPVIELEVPAGTARTFTMAAYDSEGLKPYEGTVTRDLIGGQTTTLSIVMELLSDANNITSLDINIGGQESSGSYGIVNDALGAALGVVPLGTSLNGLAPVIEVPDGASVEPASGEPRDFSSGPVTYTVTAANGAEKEYTVNITGNSLVILDPAYEPAGRIVQIDNLQADGWTEKNGPDFKPYDVDYDIYGRIYIANNNWTNGGVLRLDGIGDTSPEWIVSDVQVPAIAVDRLNGWVYYLADAGDSYYQLKRCDYNGENEKTYAFELQDSSGNAGLTIDDEGFVYAVMQPEGTAIQKIDPSGTGSITKQTPEVYDYNIWDILYKDGYLYVTVDDFSGTGSVKKYTTELTDTGEVLSVPLDTAHSDAGVRLTRFIGVLNTRFFVIDDSDADNDEDDRIISFDDLSGIDDVMWADKGPTTFSFFYVGGV